MLPIIDPDEDYLTIVAADEQFTASEARRKKELEEAHAKLRGRLCTTCSIHKPIANIAHLALSRILEAARVSSTRPGSVPSEQAHHNSLNELEQSGITLCKAISEAETTLASKEAELAGLKEETRRLEVYDPAAEHEKEMDGSAYVPLTITAFL